LLAGMDLKDAVKPSAPWLAWARARDEVARARQLSPPRPSPPVALRPRRMSVTKVETWIANPYAVFASEILRLEKFAWLGEQPDAALRGQIIHGALGRFAERWPDRLPDDPASALTAIAASLLSDLRPHPRVAA